MEREIKSFNDMQVERYCVVKESIESLMAIMNLEGLTKVERTRVLTALIQLINDNSEKPMDLRVRDTEEMICTGNVFSHYFSGKEAKEQAVEILSNTNLLNELEKLIYTINFYMPNDKDFIRVYSESNKDVAKIADYYGLEGEDAAKFVYARVTEISKFYKSYMDYKEKQAVSESQVFIALQEATDNPSVENIENARRLIMALQNEGLKEVLTRQLEMLGTNALSNQEVSGNGYWDIPEKPMASMDDTRVFGFSPEEEEINIPPHLETLAQEPTAYEEETLEPQLEVYVPESNEELEPVMEETVVEPEPLRVIRGTVNKEQDNVAEEVKASLQLLVGRAKKDATRVQELEGELVDARATIEEQTETIARQSDKIINFEDAIKERDERIDALESENEKLQATNEIQASTIEEQNGKIIDFEAELQKRNVHIGELKSENQSLQHKVIAYETTLNELGDMLKGTQEVGEYEENARKIA